MRAEDIKLNPYTSVVTDPNSSWIDGFKYNPDTLALDVKTKEGKMYRYQRVSTDIAARLAFAESSGKFFNNHIQGQYDYKKIKPYF